MYTWYFHAELLFNIDILKCCISSCNFNILIFFQMLNATRKVHVIVPPLAFYTVWYQELCLSGIWGYVTNNSRGFCKFRTFLDSCCLRCNNNSISITSVSFLRYCWMFLFVLSLYFVVTLNSNHTQVKCLCSFIVISMKALNIHSSYNIQRHWPGNTFYRTVCVPIFR